jgi:hypothetical protein
MANASTTGFGLRMIERLGNTPSIGGQSEYLVESAPGVGLYKNNPVSLQDALGSEGFLQDASFATTDDTGTGGAAYNATTESKLVGVFNGIFYVDNTTKKPRFVNFVDAGTTFGVDYNTGSSNGKAFVNDDPSQEYMVKVDAACPTSNNGKNFNVNDFTATDNKDGQSTVTLDIASVATTSMWKVVRVGEDPENKDITAAGANMVVVMNPLANLYVASV